MRATLGRAALFAVAALAGGCATGGGTFDERLLMSGWTTTEADCQRRTPAVWVVVDGQGDCLRYFAAGLAADLANHLGQLGELYKTIDEANPPRRSAKVERASRT